MEVGINKAAPVKPSAQAANAPVTAASPAPAGPAVTRDESRTRAPALPDAAPDAKVPEVDFSAVEPEKKAAPAEQSWYKRIIDYFMSAMSFSPLLPFNAAVSAGMALYNSYFKDADLSPEIKAALKDLAKQGKLSAADGKGPKLEDVVNELLKAGAEPDTISRVLDQILRPNSIRQMEGKSTCPTAVVQAILAEVNPGAYLQVTTDLQSTGKATLPDGTELSVNAKNMAWLKAQNFTPDELGNALFQVALAEAAVAPDSYDVATDTVEKSVNIAGHDFEWKENDGIDFKNVLHIYHRAGLPIFDPRKVKATTPAERQAALAKAIEGAKGKPAGLSLPIHDPTDPQKYHLVEVVGQDESGKIQVRDPRTGAVSSYSAAELSEMVGWDITDYSNVGNRRPRPTGSGGGEF